MVEGHYQLMPKTKKTMIRFNCNKISLLDLEVNQGQLPVTPIKVKYPVNPPKIPTSSQNCYISLKVKFNKEV